MYEKGKKLDSKGIILACVGIIAVCIAINIAFAVFPPMGRSDGTSSEESSIGTNSASEVSGDESDDGPETDGADGQGETTHVDPSIVAVPDNLPEEATQAGFQDAVAAYLTSLTPRIRRSREDAYRVERLECGNGPRWLRYPLLGHPRLLPQRDGDSRDRRFHQGRGLQRRDVLIQMKNAPGPYTTEPSLLLFRRRLAALMEGDRHRSG